MCGIAGAIGAITPAAIKTVQKMSTLQAHRGPDGAGFWQSEPQSGLGSMLAHRRLAIIDLSPTANQPMLDSSTGNAIVFNGEIYNYASLRQELKNQGASFKTDSDTEVILVAYRIWGRDFVNRLRGIFALAIWDNSRNITVCARDQLGVKPLYYVQSKFTDSQHFIFASELRALLHSGFVQRKLNAKSVSSYIWNGFVTGPDTIIEGIQLLPAGCILEVDVKGEIISLEKYWTLPSCSKHSNDVEPLKTALYESAKLQQVSDVPVGVFLSGGIDSSAVANMAAITNENPIQTFNIAFDESEFDESIYAKHVATELGAIHHEIRLTENDFGSDIDNALNSLDQPTFDGINTYFVSKAVREAGITVALAGTGGDELFGGYKSFSDIPLAAAWSKRFGFLPDPVLRSAGKIATRLKYPQFGEVPPQQRWGKLGDVLRARGDFFGTYQTSYGLFTADYHGLLLASEDHNLAYGVNPLLAEEIKSSISGMSQMEAISAFELSMFLGQRLLRDTDSASMAVSLEVRVPLLDHVVVEEAFKLSPRRRFDPLGKKKLLRELATPNIDPAHFERKKSGFVIPIEIWSKSSLKSVIEETFKDQELTRSVGLNQDAILNLYHAFQAGTPGIYWSRIWAIFVLLHWCRHNKVGL